MSREGVRWPRGRARESHAARSGLHRPGQRIAARESVANTRAWMDAGRVRSTSGHAFSHRPDASAGRDARQRCKARRADTPGIRDPTDGAAGSTPYRLDRRARLSKTGRARPTSRPHRTPRIDVATTSRRLDQHRPMLSPCRRPAVRCLVAPRRSSTITASPDRTARSAAPIASARFFRCVPTGTFAPAGGPDGRYAGALVVSRTKWVRTRPYVDARDCVAGRAFE